MIIFDTCIWISLIDENDINHEKAVEILCSTDISDMVILDQVYTETLSVLRYKISEEACKQFTMLVHTHDIALINSFDDFEKTTSLFIKHKKLSFVDTTLLYWKQEKGYEVITFDKALQKLLRL